MMSDDEKQTFIHFIAADGCVLVFSKNNRKDILLFRRVCACAGLQQQNGSHHKKHEQQFSCQRTLDGGEIRLR